MPSGKVSKIWRRVGTGILCLIVIAGAAGLLGVRSRTTSSGSVGWRLTVTYPQIARAGLDVPWRAEVHHSGGLPSKITMAVSTDYFRMFETQGFYPDADSATNDGHFVYFTFTTHPGDDFMVDYDAYVQPGSQLGKSAVVELLIGGSVKARVALHTWLVP
ncbi:MAG TPA: hypothetical protein VGH30_11400 [Jatrophihabitantaceae bacterium]|jgi:hypothetical protein